MTRRFKGLTDPGLLRSVNQDDYYIDPEGRFFIVADGMGGHAGGQEASQIATKEIQAYLDLNWDSDSPSNVLLKEALFRANQSILDKQYTNPQFADMGTTVLVVLFRQQESWRAHVGDSRLYRLREEQLEQITEDHTWVARTLKAGKITLEQSKTHPLRHVLFQCLGRKGLQFIEIETLDVQAGDLLLLCSDGLTEELEDSSIEKYLQSSSTCEEAVSQLIVGAKEAGGSDNITAILIAED